MACVCKCGRPIDCGEISCGVCEDPAAPEREDGLPNGMKAEDYNLEE